MRIRANLSWLFKIFSALSLLLVVFFACSKKSLVTNPTNQASALLLKVNFTDNSLVDLIRGAVLIVTLPERNSSIRTDLTFQNGLISGSVEVLAGVNRIFKLEAVDSLDAVIYRGIDTIDVIGGQITEVKINLTPVVFLLRLSPVYREVSRLDSFFVDVKLHLRNDQNLFGVSFRVEYDTALLSCTQVSPGNFLGPDSTTIFFSRIDSSGYVAVSYTKVRGDTSGVTGSERLARLYFKASGSPGLTDLIFNRQTLSFSDPDSVRNDWKASVYLHNAQVLIK